MNGTTNEDGDVVPSYSDKESETSDNESDTHEFKAADRQVEEMNWSNASSENGSVAMTTDDATSHAMDPLASPDAGGLARLCDNSSPHGKNMSESSNSRRNSVNGSPAGRNRSDNDKSRSVSPDSAKSRSATPENDTILGTQNDLILGGQNDTILGSQNDTISSQNANSVSRDDSKSRSASPDVAKTHSDVAVRDKSRSLSPSRRRRSGSPPDAVSGSVSPNASRNDGNSSPVQILSTVDSSVRILGTVDSPVKILRTADSPVRINSDSEDDKDTNMIDLESDDDCMIVEEKAQAQAQAKKSQRSPTKAEKKESNKKQNGIEKERPKTPEESPESGGLRRSLRNTKRKSYKDILQTKEEEEEEESESTDSEAEVKRKKITPPSPVTSQIKLVSTQSLMAPNKPTLCLKPIANVNKQNGVINDSVFTSMAQRGVSVVSSRQQPTPPKPKPKPKPKSPFADGSAYAAMTDGQSIIEAPSFLSPLIYVKKPTESLKGFVDGLGEEVAREQKRLDDEAEARRKEAERKEEAEKAEKEKKEKEERDKAAEEKEKELGETKDEKDDKEITETQEAVAEPKKKGRRRRKADENDESWDEDESSSDDNSTDNEASTTVILKEPEDDIINKILNPISAPAAPATKQEEKSSNYFSSPLGSFFIDIGLNLVQERVHTDLYKMQKRKIRRESSNTSLEGVMQFLSENIQRLKQVNMHYNLGRVRCQFCSFCTESALVMAHHMEVPHACGPALRCNFCVFETSGAQLMMQHVLTAHGISARFVRPPALHQCPECPFESGTKGRFVKHVERCLTLHVPDMLRPQEWQPPAKLIKASSRPNYVYNYRPRFTPRGGQGRPPAIQAPPFPHMPTVRAPRMRRPLSVVTCAMCGSHWSDPARLHEHVMREHSAAPTAAAPAGVVAPGTSANVATT